MAYQAEVQEKRQFLVQRPFTQRA